MGINIPINPANAVKLAIKNFPPKLIVLSQSINKI